MHSFHKSVQYSVLQMSTGLTAAKCPSCKIILLRPIHYSSCDASPRSSATMHCPACRQQYSLRKGTIIPAIVLAPATGIPAKTNMDPSINGANFSPILRRASPLASEAATLTLACCSLRSPLRVPQPPRNLHARSSSFTNESISSPTSVLGSKPKRRMHHRAGSLHLTIKDSGQSLAPPSEGISRSISSDKIQQVKMNNVDKNLGSKLGRIRAFLSGSMLRKVPFSPSGSSPTSSELPPVIRGGKRRTLKRRVSLSDLRMVGSDTEASAEKPHLSSIDHLRQEFTSMQQSGDCEYLQEMYSNTFSSWEDISNSFKSADSDFGVNLELVHYAYSAMLEMPKCVQKATMKSIINCFLKDSRNLLHTQHRDCIKARLILMENPQFYDPSTYVIFAQLLKQLSQVSPDTHKCVICWLRAAYQPKWLKSLVAKIQYFISRRQFSQNSSDIPVNNKTNWWVPCAVRVLSLIREASLTCKPPLLSHTEFYNSTLDHIDLMNEFYTWQNSTNHSVLKFSYCNHPFILSLSAKKYILQHDSEHQMLMMARRSLAKMHQSEAPNSQNVFLDLKIRRSHLIEDSISELVFKKSDLKKKVKLTFTGEPGIDMGGLTKEWFLLLIRMIFKPDYGLFTTYKHSDFCWFSLGLTGDHRSSEYHLVGLLMGLAVYNGIILDLNFPLCCFKKLLTPLLPPNVPELEHEGNTVNEQFSISEQVEAPKFSLDDLAAVMPTIAQSLKQLQDYEGDVDDLCYTFQVSHQAYSTIITTELVPNGASIPITNDNKNEFIELYIDHLLNKSISQQFAAFHYGFHSVCNSNALKLLCPEELEALVCGYPEFNVQALRSVTTYEGYEKTDSTIEAFWSVVNAMAGDKQKKLMQFVTGSCRVPVEGVSSIEFKISRFSASTDTSILPMAHTCFNQLLLPPYKCREVLREKLVIAISNSEGFGLV